MEYAPKCLVHHGAMLTPIVPPVLPAKVPTGVSAASIAILRPCLAGAFHRMRDAAAQTTIALGLATAFWATAWG